MDLKKSKHKMQYIENIFTKIKNKVIPSKVYYEDADAILIEDINKQKKYHFLLLPKHDASNLSDLMNSSNHYINFCISLKKALVYLKQEFNIVDYNIIINNGASAGQEVMHLHIHILAN